MNRTYYRQLYPFRSSENISNPILMKFPLHFGVIAVRMARTHLDNYPLWKDRNGWAAAAAAAEGAAEQEKTAGGNKKNTAVPDSEGLLRPVFPSSIWKGISNALTCTWHAIKSLQPNQMFRSAAGGWARTHEDEFVCLKADPYPPPRTPSLVCIALISPCFCLGPFHFPCAFEDVDKASESWKSPKEGPSVLGKPRSCDFKAPLKSAWTNALNVAPVSATVGLFSQGTNTLSCLFNSKMLLLTPRWLIFLNFHSHDPIFFVLTMAHTHPFPHMLNSLFIRYTCLITCKKK